MNGGGDFAAPTSIDGVLAALDAVVERSAAGRSRVGFFAALYAKVTTKVKEGVGTGFFEDPERMARLDIAFARRYLEALHGWESGEPITLSWARAFEAAADPRPVAVQHLLLGVNAHINLDLGIAAATVAPGDALPALRGDFDRVNEILGMQIDAIENELGRISPLLGLFDRLGGRNEEELIRFSLEVARAGAWRFATELAPLAPEHWGGPVGARDARVARVARMVLRPGLLLEAALLAVRAFESGDVPSVIAVLRGAPEPALAVVDRRVRQWRASGREG